MSFVQKNHSVVLAKVKRILMTGVSMGALCFIATPEPVFAQTLPQNINPVPSPVLSDLVNKGGVVTHTPPPVNGANGKDAHVKIGIPPKRVEATAGSNGGNGGSFVVGGGGQYSANGKNIFVAGSTGGAGGNGGSAGRLMKGDGAAGGNGGNGGNVSVNSTGGLTVHDGSAIVAFSNGGRGGKGGDGSALTGSIKSGAGGNGGNAGQVSVINDGQIVVHGNQSFGIFAQAAGGNGGKAGDADGDFANALATSSGNGGHGGTVIIKSTNDISVYGAGSDAIHGLSAGGVGTDAAEAKSTFSSATNGVAGNGGNAGTVTIISDKKVYADGAKSNGLVGKSVGGKGGNGNNVTPGGSVDTTTAGGGNGGNGGAVNITNNGSVTVTNGHAIYAESTGGAGGTSGSSVAALSKTKSGNGGSGGNAGAVSVDNSGDVTTKTASSGAIVAVSTGGQGGSANYAGGLRQAEAGSGGTGGDGGKVTVSNGASVRTQGNNSNAIIAASTGGNGSHGGWAGAATDATSGNGGNGGNSAKAEFTNGGTIKTQGDNSAAVIVSSAGGTGGNGGFSVGGGVAASGSGGQGGHGGAVTVTNTGDLLTNGNLSGGVIAISRGGSGGNSGWSVAVGDTTSGSGGHGGTAAQVTVDNQKEITTEGEHSNAVTALSVGGQGGNAGWAAAIGKATSGKGGKGGDAGSLSLTNSGSISTEGASSSAVIASSDGGKGGAGGVAGSVYAGDQGGGAGGKADCVTVVNNGDISTAQSSSLGIIAQSNGGAGGDGGLHVSIASNGGDGGKGGAAGAVSVTNNGTIETGLAAKGTSSSVVTGSAAIVAQSLGGDGGKSGSNVTVAPLVSGSVGGTGGAGGDAGTVNVTSGADSSIVTHGDQSAAIIAQSIGGKGGKGDLTVTVAAGPGAGAGALGTIGGKGGDGAKVTIDTAGVITTHGNGSIAVLASSVGGNGDEGGLVITGADSTLASVAGSVARAGGAGGNAGEVSVVNAATISTKGNQSSAIAAVSAGGKVGHGGHAGVATSGNLNVFHETSDGIGGDAGAVDVSNSGVIVTTGDAAGAIIALSQGVNADAVTINNTGDVVTTGAQSAGLSAQSLGKTSAGGVTVANSGSVITNGAGSNALTARSVVEEEMLFASRMAPQAVQSFASPEVSFFLFDFVTAGGGQAGNVSVDHNGVLIAAGDGSSAIYAQSTGTTNGNIDIDVHAESLLVGGAVGGAGVTMIDGAQNSLANHGTITAIGNTIGYIPRTDGALLGAGWIDGMAMQGTTGDTAITNTGLVVGNISMGSGTSTFTNTSDGWMVAGSQIGLGGQAGSLFTNAGVLSSGGVKTVQTTVIDGSFDQTETGKYLVELDFAGGAADNLQRAAAVAAPSASGKADKLEVTGQANLGGHLPINISNTGYAKSGQNDYVIVHAEGGVNDDGMQLEAPNTAVATFTLGYTQYETILGANIDYAARGLTENGIAVGTTVNAIQFDQRSPAFRPLAEAIFAQPDIASLQRTYDLIDGEGTAGAQQAYFSDTNAFIGTVSQQTNLWSNPYRLGNDKADRSCTLKNNICVESLWRGWYSGFGSDTSLQGDPYVVGSGDLKSHSKGMAAGLDYELTKDLLLGFSVGMSKANFKVNDRLTQGDIETGRTAIYGAYRHNNLYIDGLFGVDWFNASTDRMAAILPTAGNAGFSDRLQNDFSGYGINARLETGYRMDLGGVQFSPFATLQLSSFHMNGSTESADVTGGDLALYYKSRTINSVPLSLGAQFDTRIELGENAYFSPYVRAAWVHEFSNKRSVEAGFTAAPGYEFVVHGAAQARNSAQVEAGFNVQIETGLSLYGKVTGNFSGSDHDVSGSGGLRLRW